MCGIAGIVALQPEREPASREALLRMASVLRHRGPDEAGLYRDERAGLVHTRLSIVDLATGQQPLANEDETLWIVFNGEIFNHVELRAQLVAAGHRFRTRSDTEVIVHAWEEWGETAFDRMNGQWAVALWDERAARLVLARDPCGICPLYLHEQDGVVTFASEVKAIFASSDRITRRLDPLGIDETFNFWSVVPPQSVFAGVTELRPGCVRIYEADTVRERAAPVPAFPRERDGATGFTGSLDEAVERVRAEIERATRLRMVRADVPVGSYLSGGLDSSFVAALARQFASGTFHTFSLRFEDAEYDETSFQRTVAQQIGSEHHEVVVKRDDIGALFPEVIWHTERPILRTAPAPLFCLSQLVRDHGIKVVLTGEGADEVFAGYDLFREGKVRRFWARDPASKLRPRLLERLYPWYARSPVAARAMSQQFFGRNLAAHDQPGFAHEPRWRATAALQRLYSADQRAAASRRDPVAALLADLPDELPSWGALQQDQYLEMRTLLAGYLLSSQGDRMLLGHGVEGRFPFLDPQVMALAHSLPASYKLKVLDEKHVLKRAAAPDVPAAILARKKQPYRAPDAASFIGAGAPEYVSELLGERAVADAGIFDPKAVARLWAKCRSASADSAFSNTDNMALVGVLSTQLVHHHFVARAPSADAAAVTLATDVDRTPEVCR